MTQNRIETLAVVPTVPRQTPANEFGAVLGRTLGAAAREGTGVLSRLAGGNPVLTAAVSSLNQVTSFVGGPGDRSMYATTPAPGGDSSDLLEAQRSLQSQSQSFNLQYLQLQEELQQESRRFTTLSNVIKVRHDSAKAAINNIR